MKKKNKFIALGCSLTAQPGYIDFLKNEYNLNITNLAVGAGSNLLQQHRLNNLYVRNEIDSNSVLLWQITFPKRNHLLVDDKTHYLKKHQYINEKVELFNLPCYALLTHNSYFEPHQYSPNYDENLQTLAVMIHWSFMCKQIIVYLGWDFMDDNVYNIFSNFISKRSNILMLPNESNIVGWCKKQQLEFTDDLHPCKESYIEWAKHNLIPVLGLNLK
jgi:hypothetical protein